MNSLTGNIGVCFQYFYYISVGSHSFHSIVWIHIFSLTSKLGAGPHANFRHMGCSRIHSSNWVVEAQTMGIANDNDPQYTTHCVNVYGRNVEFLETALILGHYSHTGDDTLGY